MSEIDVLFVGAYRVRSVAVSTGGAGSDSIWFTRPRELILLSIVGLLTSSRWWCHEWTRRTGLKNFEFFSNANSTPKHVLLPGNLSQFLGGGSLSLSVSLSLSLFVSWFNIVFDCAMIVSQAYKKMEFYLEYWENFLLLQYSTQELTC